MAGLCLYMHWRTQKEDYLISTVSHHRSVFDMNPAQTKPMSGACEEGEMMCPKIRLVKDWTP